MVVGKMVMHPMVHSVEISPTNPANPWIQKDTLQGMITYPTWGKGKSSSKGYVSSQEGTLPKKKQPVAPEKKNIPRISSSKPIHFEGPNSYQLVVELKAFDKHAEVKLDRLPIMRVKLKNYLSCHHLYKMG